MPYYFLIPPIVAVLTQCIKLAIDRVKGNLNWRHMIAGYGGMPSSHTALATSIATTVALVDGLYTGTMVIAFGLAVVIARDATGYRRQIGHHAAILNEQTKSKIKLPTRVGHEWSEVIVGGLVGIGLTLALWLLTAGIQI